MVLQWRNFFKLKTMRPPKFSDKAIIVAGEALQAEGRRITGFTLRQKTGGGDPARLLQVWQKHLSQSAQHPEFSAELADASERSK
jgi:hypothetical protein